MRSKRVCEGRKLVLRAARKAIARQTIRKLREQPW